MLPADDCAGAIRGRPANGTARRFERRLNNTAMLRHQLYQVSQIVADHGSQLILDASVDAFMKLFEITCGLRGLFAELSVTRKVTAA